MSRFTSIELHGLFCVIACLGSIGCGGEAVGTAEKAHTPEAMLRDAGEIYRLSVVRNKKPPASFKELRLGSEFPVGLRAIESGDIVVAYGAAMADRGEEDGLGEEGTVIAYLKDVPTSGGLVLMANRTIKNMTADEFKAVPKPTAVKPGETKSARSLGRKK